MSSAVGAGPGCWRDSARLSLEPDSCLRRAEGIFARHGARSMLAAKFVPGLTTVMPPLAGVFAVSRVRFALYDLAGVLLWAGTWMGLGYLLQRRHRPDHRPSHRARAHARLSSSWPRSPGTSWSSTRAATCSCGSFGRPASRPRRSSGGSTPEKTSRSSISGPRSTSRPHLTPSREPLAGRRRHRRAGGRVPPISGGRGLLRLAQRRDGRRGGASAETQGITRVRPLEGGLAAWMALKFPVRRVRVPVVAADGRSRSVHSSAA